MLKAKDGDFFVTDCPRNRNTMEFLGVRESVYNPNFNYGEFATIRNQSGTRHETGLKKEQRTKAEAGNARNRTESSAISVLPNCTCDGE